LDAQITFCREAVTRRVIFDDRDPRPTTRVTPRSGLRVVTPCAEPPGRTDRQTMPATTPPSTPLQVREYQRKAQRCVRLAANSVNRGRDCWEDAAKNGREHITDFTNALLEER